MKVTKRPKLTEIKELWHLVDATDHPLGRLASKIAQILSGKDTPIYEPSVSPKTKVVVINAAKIKLTGRKLGQKQYLHHSGYPGGLKSTPLSTVMSKRPSEALRRAVYGMLPKNKLRDERMNNLKIYAEDSHPHIAQNPVKLEL